MCIGWAAGAGFGKLTLYLRKEQRQALGMKRFLTLRLIALVYGTALSAQASGFLAVFAAGLALPSGEHTEAKHLHLDVTDTTPTVDSPATGSYLAKGVLEVCSISLVGHAPAAHGGLVWRARGRLALIPYLCHDAWGGPRWRRRQHGLLGRHCAAHDRPVSAGAWFVGNPADESLPAHVVVLTAAPRAILRGIAGAIRRGGTHVKQQVRQQRN